MGIELGFCPDQLLHPNEVEPSKNSKKSDPAMGFDIKIVLFENPLDFRVNPLNFLNFRLMSKSQNFLQNSANFPKFIRNPKNHSFLWGLSSNFVQINSFTETQLGQVKIPTNPTLLWGLTSQSFLLEIRRILGSTP